MQSALGMSHDFMKQLAEAIGVKGAEDEEP